MTNWPAFCKKCGASFNSGISIAPEVKGVKITNCISVCPNCGASVNIPDGGTDDEGNVYFLSAVYKALTDSQVSNDDLYVISDVIKRAQQNKEKPVSVIDKLGKKAPSAVSFIELLKPKTAGDFYGMLAFVLALIVYIQSQTEKPKELPQQVINNITINQTYIDTKPKPKNIPPKQAANKKITKKEKIGRNSPCPCGSGKKFKRCCGK